MMLNTRTLALLIVVGAPIHARSQTLQVGEVRSESKSITLRGSGTVSYTLGFLGVPENRAEPTSRTIEIAFLRLPAKTGVVGPPLIYLAGGPGDAGITEDAATLAEWDAARAIGDVILVDQRGTGRSRPNLGYRWRGAPPVNLFRSEADANAFTRLLADSVTAHFRAQGADLRGYTTNESADDIDALRKALGAERMSVFGFSYGTHLALTVIRRHGEHVANTVLIGTEGPPHTMKLPSTMDVQWRKLALMAAADTTIARLVPDVDALLTRVLEKLDREPVVVSVKDARSGNTLQVPIGKHGLLNILRRDFGDASDLPVFPRLLYSIDRGDTAVLQWFVQKRYAIGINAMSVAMDIASGVSPERLTQIVAEASRSRFGNIANFPLDGGLAAFGVSDLGEAFRVPVVSNVRTLFLSGTLDWNTPPFQAEEVRWGFPNSWHIIVQNAGHEQVLPHPSVGKAIIRFLKGEDIGDVTAALPPLKFVPLEGHDTSRAHPSVSRR